MIYYTTKETTFKIVNKSNSSCITYDAAIGTLISFCVHGREVLYFNSELDPDSTIIDRGGIPVLFPVCGSLLDDTYKIDNKPYNMPKHGFALGIPWKTRAVQEKEGGQIIAELHADERTLGNYPFNFAASITYRLKGAELLIEQEYSNNGQGTMKFYAGLHPYFTVNDKKSLKLVINADKFGDDSSGEMIEREYTGAIDFDNIVDFIFRLNDSGEKRYSFIDPVEKREIIIETGAEFKHMVMWTKDRDSRFLCLEPWMAQPDAMNTGEDVYCLEPGESLKTWVKISVKDNY